MDFSVRTHFEVERRINKNLESALSSEAVLSKAYGGTDTYFSFYPFLRVRQLDLTFPTKKRVEMIGYKRIVDDGEIEETSRYMDAAAALNFLNENLGKPIVTVEVERRKEFSLGSTTVCIDGGVNAYREDIKKCLGDWTEIEVESHKKEENAKALQEVEETFEKLGVPRELLVKSIYPVISFDNLKFNHVPNDVLNHVLGSLYKID